MAINTKSIRARFLGLLTVTAVVITAVSVVYDLVSGGAVIREQIVKRGRYVASNLACDGTYTPQCNTGANRYALTVGVNYLLDKRQLVTLLQSRDGCRQGRRWVRRLA